MALQNFKVEKNEFKRFLKAFFQLHSQSSSNTIFIVFKSFLMQKEEIENKHPFKPQIFHCQIIPFNKGPLIYIAVEKYA